MSALAFGTVYVVIDKDRQLVAEPNEYVTMGAAFIRSDREPDTNFIPVSWEEANLLQRERRDRLNPPEPEICMCCGQEVLS